MRNRASVCPVPDEQQPVNEYQELKESWLFSWVTLEVPQYLKKLICVWAISLLISCPVAAASFPPEKDPVHFFIGGGGGALLLLILVWLRLYLGWIYVRSRLLNTQVFYEETGWYDGQIWLKTPEVLTKDRLIFDYQVKPLLQRLRRTFYGFFILIIIGSLLWGVL